jgi:hypothetical protein
MDTIEVYRSTIDRLIDIYGFDVDLYVPKINTVSQQESLDIYAEKPDDIEHFNKPIKTKVFIDWKPDMKRLRRLGIFTEAALPLIAWFKNIPELTRKSYIRVTMSYQAEDWGTDEFELVDCLIKNMYNAIVIQCWNIAPRRK